MGVLSAILGLSGVVVCGVLFLVILGVVAFIWFWKHQPDQETSADAPAPPIQPTIEHPTSAATPPAAPPTEPPAPPSPDA